MKKEISWLPILIQCRDNVKRRITPLLKTAKKQQQPNLGIGAGGDPIKQIDIEAEKAIVETLVRQGISFTLISEESGIKEYGGKPDENYVTVDPIDGTTNLTRGIPFYATSIAVSTKLELNAVHTALVADLSHGTTYTAEKGGGAYRDGKKMVPSKQTSLEEAVIGIDLNTYKAREIASCLTSLIEKTKHIRHLGANALELCYVADGTTDAFIDIRGKLRTTDTAAAWLIIREAGALITTPNGKPLEAKLDPKERLTFVASANLQIHEKILSLMKEG
ncbi:fructose 1,6-bisphosphatase [Candidatus Bathyarchaeota archaeon]|nr:fructose 1,6-bisphosphatase [Candidatus Bathyarchaeota archaeon]